MEIIVNTNKDYTCTDCGKKNLSLSMYKIKFRVWYSCVFLCKDCLFKLYLELNNIFQDSLMTDVNNLKAVNKLYREHLGIPRIISDLIKEGKYIAAMKEWKDLNPDLSLTKCRDQVYKWRVLFPECKTRYNQRKELYNG